MFGGRFRNIFVYLIILVAAAFLFFNFSSQSEKVEETPISQVAAEARAGMIEQITVTGDYSTLKVEFKDGREPVVSRKGSDADVVEVLRNLGVGEEEIAAITIEYQQPSGWASWMPLLGGILPVILFVGVFYFLLRQAQGTNSQALSFGKSRARMFSGDQPTVTFEDVAGVEEAKEELYEVVEFLQEPEKFISLGA
ncbi:MAG: ATP-dependent metallopeptidase FtsH/Yme1/Tma family protein, partial [Anaerolineae bacterium]